MSAAGAEQTTVQGAGAARLIDGEAAAAELRGRVRGQVEALRSRHGITPGLAVVQVGDDAASAVYVRTKRRRTQEAGMTARDHDLPAETSQDELLALIDELNHDPSVHGILVQLPLPSHIDSAAVMRAIDPAKDVDGFHEVNVGRLWSGGGGLVPCTPLGCMILLNQVHPSMTGLNALVIGCSQIVGKPLASLLLEAQCTVTMAHEFTRDLPALCRQADVVAVAVGCPELVRGDWIKPGATVIDIGINRIAGEQGQHRLVGDVAFDEAERVAGAITPVPGGVGPMTIACLLQNTVTAACRLNGVAVPDVTL